MVTLSGGRRMKPNGVGEWVTCHRGIWRVPVHSSTVTTTPASVPFPSSPRRGQGVADRGHTGGDVHCPPLAGRRGPHLKGACLEPAGGGDSCPHHPASQHLDVSVATKDRSLSVHNTGDLSPHLGCLALGIPWRRGLLLHSFPSHVARESLSSENLCAVF